MGYWKVSYAPFINVLPPTAVTRNIRYANWLEYAVSDTLAEGALEARMV